MANAINVTGLLTSYSETATGHEPPLTVSTVPINSADIGIQNDCLSTRPSVLADQLLSYAPQEPVIGPDATSATNDSELPPLNDKHFASESNIKTTPPAMEVDLLTLLPQHSEVDKLSSSTLTVPAKSGIENFAMHVPYSCRCGYATFKLMNISRNITAKSTVPRRCHRRRCGLSPRVIQVASRSSPSFRRRATTLLARRCSRRAYDACCRPTLTSSRNGRCATANVQDMPSAF